MKGGIALLAVVPSLAFACINDRDTLKFEQQNINALERITGESDPGKRAEAVGDLALRAIAGRFERFPNKYYEMRIDRLEALPKLTAHEVDDLAVAYDRIGKFDKAIEIILNSKAQRKTKEDRYRFHANYGTFLVHKWVAQGAKKDEKGILKESISEIEAALTIDPKSHFGRENVQLALEKAWLKPDQAYEIINKLEAEDISVGASGIIMMGLGYELPDVYDMLANATSMDESIAASSAVFRAMELEKKGKPALLDSRSTPQKEERPLFIQLRKDGEKVHTARLAYMDERFAKGKHPDTDPQFWSQWKEPNFPTSVRVDDSAQPSNYSSIANSQVLATTITVIPLLLGVSVFTAIGVYAFKRNRR